MDRRRLTRMLLRLALAAAALIVGGEPARAANYITFFFADKRDPLDPRDDQMVVRRVSWNTQEPMKWHIADFSTFGTMDILPLAVNSPLPGINGPGITDAEVIAAMRRALRAWNDNPLGTTFRFDETVVPTASVPAASRPIDIGLDGYNLTTFQTQNAIIGDDPNLLGITSFFFLTRAISKAELEVLKARLPGDLFFVDGFPIGDNALPIDEDGDGIVDVVLQIRDYEQGEIIDADVAMNPITEWLLAPADPADFPSNRSIASFDFIDLQAILGHEIGHAIGIGHSWLTDSAMAPFYSIDPRLTGILRTVYDVRTLRYDDYLAVSALYGGVNPPFPHGEIEGSVFDGFFDPTLITTITIQDLIDGTVTTVPPDQYVLQAPVFLAVPVDATIPELRIFPSAEPRPDEIQTAQGRIRLIGNVLTGDTLRLAVLQGTIDDWVPGLGMVVSDDPFAMDIVVVGLDNPNLLGLPRSELDSLYRFSGLPPRDDYIIYIDPQVTTTTGIFPEQPQDFISQPSLELFSFETPPFPPEFFGGLSGGAGGDAATGDDPFTFDPITVLAGFQTADVDVITNTDVAGGPTPTPLPTPGPGDTGVNTFTLTRQADAFEVTNYIALGGDIGDIDGDGFLDLVVAVFTGSTDVSGQRINRILLNRPVDPNDPNSLRRFVDVTFGDDRTLGTADDRMPPDPDISRDVKLADFNGNGRLDLFVSNASNAIGVGFGGLNRVYLNMPFGDPNDPDSTEDLNGNGRLDPGEDLNGNGRLDAKDFRFVDVSESVLGGVLNYGWSEALPDPLSVDDSFRIAVGDIDSDGDMDVIITLFTPIQDQFVDPVDMFLGTRAMVDNFPIQNNNPGDDLYTEQGTQQTRNDLRTGNATADLALTFSERVLINYRLDLGQEVPTWLPRYDDVNCNGILDVHETEDLNENGVLDHEDANGNFIFDFEDINGNGILDDGEDLNENGVLDTEDANGNGIWETEDYVFFVHSADSRFATEIAPLINNGQLDTYDFNGDGVINRPEDIDFDFQIGGDPRFCGIQAHGFVLVDETLGADGFFGDSGLIPSTPTPTPEGGGGGGDDDGGENPIVRPKLARNALATPTPEPPVFDGTLIVEGDSFNRANLDRVPPNWSSMYTIGGQGQRNATASPVSPRAVEPLLAPFHRTWGGLGLVSIRALNPGNPMFFANVDVDGDGIGDGFYYTINFGADFITRDGSALFPGRAGLNQTGDDALEIDDFVPATQPLWLGLPDGIAGDTAGPEGDVFERVPRGAYAGAIADFESRGSNMPMILTDNDYTAAGGARIPAVYYTPFQTIEAGQAGNTFLNPDAGYSRQTVPTVEGGLSVAYFPMVPGLDLSAIGAPGAFTLSLTGPFPTRPGMTPLSLMEVRNIPNDTAGTVDEPFPGTTPGEPHGVAVADFDDDGDLDVAIANTFVTGFTTDGAIIIDDTPAPNSLHLNDKFGAFTNASNLLAPNEPRISQAALAGDIDNDGDVDVVFLNSLASHELFVNGLYRGVPPDLVARGDRPMFQDMTPLFLPQALRGGFFPPFLNTVLFAGETVAAASADFNRDGYPDYALAEGGTLSLGDYSQVAFGVGPIGPISVDNRVQGLKYFKLLGQVVPGARIQTPVFSTIAVNGYLTDDIRGPGAYTDVVAADLNDDGFDDLFFVRNGDGPSAYVNWDSRQAAALFLVPPFLLDLPRNDPLNFEVFFNTQPDRDYDIDGDGFRDFVPDGVFVNTFDHLLHTYLVTEGLSDPNLPKPPDDVPQFLLHNDGFLTDPGVPIERQFHLKRHGRAAVAADFDRNGALDILIGNGIDFTGAPNVLLMNFPITLPPMTSSDGLVETDEPLRLPNLIDVTETNLPTFQGIGILDNTYVVAAADFDQDGWIDMVFANQNFQTPFPGFRYLKNLGAAGPVNFVDVAGRLPVFNNTRPRALVVADFDGLGEFSEDANHNGILDHGEDLNGDGAIDRIDLASEWFEDLNCNGILDPGEDLNGNGRLDFSEDTNGNGVLDFEFSDQIPVQGFPEWLNNGQLDSEDTNDNGVLDGGDMNGDGILTCRRAGVWDGSLDIFISFENQQDRLFLNDPTGRNPGTFVDVTETHLPILAGLKANSRGARAGDIDNDGDIDIVVAQERPTAFSSPILLLLNDGTGRFIDASHEFGAPTSIASLNTDPTVTVSDFPGNARDVELLDVDADGDLDVLVVMASHSTSTLAPIGSYNAFYVNRLVSKGYQTAPPVPQNRRHQMLFEARVGFEEESAPAPIVIAAQPNWASPGMERTIEITGGNFGPETRVNFGEGVLIRNTQYMHPGKLIVQIAIERGAPFGPRRITALSSLTGRSSSTKNGFFEIVDNSNEVPKVHWTIYK